MEYDMSLFGQMEAWLVLLLLYHPSLDTEEFRTLEHDVMSSELNPAQIKNLLIEVRRLAQADKRIRSD